MRDWEEGIVHFNSRRYWEAHESWERSWKQLKPPLKIHLQAWIQLSASLHLFGLGRTSGASSTAKNAASKLAALRQSRAMENVFPRIEIDGAEEALRSLSEASGEGLEKIASRLRARLVLADR